MGVVELEQSYPPNSPRLSTYKKLRPQEETMISFSQDHMVHINIHYDDGLVIIAKVGGFNTKRILLDKESSTNIMFLDAIKSIGQSKKEIKKRLISC